jgi:hypothetical protein
VIFQTIKATSSTSLIKGQSQFPEQNICLRLDLLAKCLLSALPDVGLPRWLPGWLLDLRQQGVQAILRIESRVSADSMNLDETYPDPFREMKKTRCSPG